MNGQGEVNGASGRQQNGWRKGGRRIEGINGVRSTITRPRAIFQLARANIPLKSPIMFKTGAQTLLLTILAGLFLLRESTLRPCSAIDQRFADWLAVSGPRRSQPDPAPVTLVGIDDASTRDHPLPWTPLDYSLFAQAALTFRPEVTAFGEPLDWDLSTAAPGERQKLSQYEKILADTLLHCRKLLLAARLGWPDDPQLIPPLQETPIIRRITGNLRRIPEWTVIEKQPRETYRLSAALGFTNVLEENGAIDTVPLVLRYRGQVVPSFVLQAVLMWQKLPMDDISVELGSHISVGQTLQIPIDEEGAMRVNFGTPKTVMSFDDLLLSTEQIAAKQKPAAPVDRLRGGIALLARDDYSARTLPLALGRKGSEGELFAAAIATIQRQDFVTRAPVWADLLIIAAAALASLRSAAWRKGVFAAGSAFAGVLYVVGALALFAFTRIWLPLVLPVGLVMIIVLWRLALPDDSSRRAEEEAKENAPAKAAS